MTVAARTPNCKLHSYTMFCKLSLKKIGFFFSFLTKATCIFYPRHITFDGDTNSLLTLFIQSTPFIGIAKLFSCISNRNQYSSENITLAHPFSCWTTDFCKFVATTRHTYLLFFFFLLFLVLYMLLPLVLLHLIQNFQVQNFATLEKH